MRRPVCALAFLAVTLSPAFAAAEPGYEALVNEYKTLKSDPDVVAFLEKNLRLSQDFEEADRNMRNLLAESQENLKHARDAGAVKGGPTLRSFAGPGFSPSPLFAAEPKHTEAEYRQMAAKNIEEARDILVDAVAGYREVKAVSTTAKASKKKGN